MTELSASMPAPDQPPGLDAPERRHLVAAVAAVMDGEEPTAALCLQDAVDASSLDVVERRVAVAERALRRDAELDGRRDDVPAGTAAAADDRWSPLWRGLHVVARLAERAGYPPDVLA